MEVRTVLMDASVNILDVCVILTPVTAALSWMCESELWEIRRLHPPWCRNFTHQPHGIIDVFSCVEAPWWIIYPAVSRKSHFLSYSGCLVGPLPTWKPKNMPGFSPDRAGAPFFFLQSKPRRPASARISASRFEKQQWNSWLCTKMQKSWWLTKSLLFEWSPI